MEAVLKKAGTAFIDEGCSQRVKGVGSSITAAQRHFVSQTDLTPVQHAARTALLGFYFGTSGRSFDERLCGNAEALMQLPDHLERKWPSAIEHFSRKHKEGQQPCAALKISGGEQLILQEYEPPTPAGTTRRGGGKVAYYAPTNLEFLENRGCNCVRRHHSSSPRAARSRMRLFGECPLLGQQRPFLDFGADGLGRE